MITNREMSLNFEWMNSALAGTIKSNDRASAWESTQYSECLYIYISKSSQLRLYRFTNFRYSSSSQTKVDLDAIASLSRVRGMHCFVLTCIWVPSHTHTLDLMTDSKSPLNSPSDTCLMFKNRVSQKIVSRNRLRRACVILRRSVSQATTSEWVGEYYIYTYIYI